METEAELVILDITGVLSMDYNGPLPFGLIDLRPSENEHKLLWLPVVLL